MLWAEESICYKPRPGNNTAIVTALPKVLYRGHCGVAAHCANKVASKTRNFTTSSPPIARLSLNRAKECPE